MAHPKEEHRSSFRYEYGITEGVEEKDFFKKSKINMDSGRQAVSETKKAPLKDPPLESLRLSSTRPPVKPIGRLTRTDAHRGQHLVQLSSVFLKGTVSVPHKRWEASG